jgi:DNA-binding response OmpR family regulator
MPGKKILIVDGDAQGADTLARILKPLKFEVLKATDGQAGYDKFKSEKPDLVILEALLPKIHGFDLTKKITQESLGQVPVIIVTGLYKGAQYRHEALSSFGASEYFEKPVDPERFTAAIKQFLHEEEDIDEPLPDSAEVIEALSRRLSAAGTPPGPDGAFTPDKGQGG